jgi:probable F420-dependent oxidoreductase
LPIDDHIKVIAPMPRLWSDGRTWVAELRRLEQLGFDTVCVSQHLTNGWQLGPISAMAYAAASTTRLRVMSLVAQNPLQHPALLAKDIATIDRLSDGRVELGIGAGWLVDDYTALGVDFASGDVRIAQLTEALAVIRDYFTCESVDFEGSYYRINNLEALPHCVQRPNPPILIGAGSPRMLDLAGCFADIVGLQARSFRRRIDHAAVADLAAPSIAASIERVRNAAARAHRAAPRIQFSCRHVHVTDADGPPRYPSPWAEFVVGQLDSLADSPAVLVGTAAECAAKIRECHERLGISYWHLGQDVEAAGMIVEQLR